MIQLSLLGAPCPLRKTVFFRPDGRRDVLAYPKVRYFQRLQSPRLQGICQLAEYLRWLEQQSSLAIVQGVAQPVLPGQRWVRRLAYADGDYPATYASAPVQLLILDIDGLPLANGHAIQRPAAMVHEALTRFGPDFVNTHCYWQLTTSQPAHAHALYARLYFMLDAPVALADLKQWAAQHKKSTCVDPALYSPVQMVYSARPAFVGQSDPIPVRSGFLQGRQELLSSALLKTQPVKTFRTSHREPDFRPFHTYSQHGERPPFLNSQWGYKWLTRLGIDDFYPAIRGLIACAAWYSGYKTNWEEIKQAIRQRVGMSSPGSRPATYIQRIISNASLDALIEGALRKFAH